MDRTSINFLCTKGVTFFKRGWLSSLSLSISQGKSVAIGGEMKHCAHVFYKNFRLFLCRFSAMLSRQWYEKRKRVDRNFFLMKKYPRRYSFADSCRISLARERNFGSPPLTSRVTRSYLKLYPLAAANFFHPSSAIFIDERLPRVHGWQTHGVVPLAGGIFYDVEADCETDVRRCVSPLISFSRCLPAARARSNVRNSVPVLHPRFSSSPAFSTCHSLPPSIFLLFLSIRERVSLFLFFFLSLSLCHSVFSRPSRSFIYPHSSVYSAVRSSAHS